MYIFTYTYIIYIYEFNYFILSYYLYQADRRLFMANKNYCRTIGNPSDLTDLNIRTGIPIKTNGIRSMTKNTSTENTHRMT